MRRLGLWLVAGFLVGCSPEDDVVSDDAIPVVANRLAELSGMCEIADAPALTIGVAEGATEYQLYRVFGATRMSDGRIAVVNQGTQELRFYDENGVFLSASGSAGEGPGEFRSAFLVWPGAGDSLWVGDYRPWEFEVFDGTGSWSHGVRLRPELLNPPQPLGVLANGYSVASIISGGLPRDFEARSIEVVVFDPAGRPADTLGVFDGDRYGQVTDDSNSLFVSPLFGSGFEMAVGASAIALGHGSSPQLTVYSGESSFEAQMRITWDLAPEPVSNAAVDAEYDRILEGAAERTSDEFRLFVEPRVHPDRPIAGTFPSMRTVRYGRDGTLWVLTYRRQVDRDRDGDRWLAFDSNGSASCTLDAPAMQIVEFGADYVLVESNGPDGEERVEMFGLTRP